LAATTILFGGRSGEEPHPPVDSNTPESATTCPSCQRNFSPTSSFCPYDGERLEVGKLQQSVKDSLLGAVVDDRYEVLAVIGEGGMGRVYRARHRRLGRSFALKALRADLARDSALTERFIQEARAAAAVTHPNVVQINDFGTLSTGQPYFVMELLEGRTLTRILREEGPLAPGRSVAIARQIAEALAAAHATGVIHRDLKPDNIILIRPSGAHTTVKVLDFGLAKVAASSRLTRPGVVFGTPHYMSPEQAAGESFDHRVDIYALGIVMFEMVTGRVPFEADTYMGVLSKHMYAAPPKPNEYHAPAGGLSGFEEIIEGCLAKAPSERWPSMTDLARRLNTLASSQPVQNLSKAPPSPTRAQSEDLPKLPKATALYWYAAGVGLYFLIGLGLCWRIGTHQFASSRGLQAKIAPTITSASPIASQAMLGPTREGTGSPIAASQPATAPNPPVSATPAGPLPSPASAGRRPPPAKATRTESKAPVKNRKRPSVQSGDIADPWAK
jgi:serine/threonine protein kinase